MSARTSQSFLDELAKIAKFHDQIHGGKADKKRPSDFNPRDLKMGEEVESEHSSDPQIREEISMDHLTENPHYYRIFKLIKFLLEPKDKN